MGALILSDWIAVGVVGKAHGLKGAFFLGSRAGALGYTLPAHCPILLDSAGDINEYTLAAPLSASLATDPKPILRLQNITTRNSIEAMVGARVLLPRSVVLPDSTTEYLWQDLIGKNIQASDLVVGSITKVNNYGASDIITIKYPQGTLDVPFVKDYFDFSFLPQDSDIKLLVPWETLVAYFNEP